MDNKTINNYNIKEKEKKEIINYSYEIVRGIDNSFFKNNNIRLNLFIEVIYDISIQTFLETGDYHIKKKDLTNAYLYSKNTEELMDKYVNNETELLSIDEIDTFYFKVIKYLE